MNTEITFMKYKCLIHLFGVLLITSSCTSSDNVSYSEEGCEEIVIDPTERQMINRSELFSLERVIKLKNSSGTLIGEIENILAHEDFLVINSNDISLYDYEGNFLKKIGRSGRGPGEYLSKFIAYNKKNLFIMDRTQQKIIKYRLSDGSYVSDDYVKIWGQAIINWKEMNLVYAGNELTPYNEKLFIFDKNNNLLTSHFDIKEHEKYYMHFYEKTNFYNYKDSIRFLYAFNNGIYSIGIKGKDTFITKRYCVDFGSYSIPEEFFQQPFRNVRDFITTLYDTDYAYQIMGYYETDHNLMFMFRYGSELLMAIYSKENKETIVIENIFDDLLFKGLTIPVRNEFFPSYFFSNGSVYFALHAEQFIGNVEKAKRINPDIEWESVWNGHSVMSLYEDMDYEDNPIVFEFKMNKLEL